jgi:hypothetical protein
MTRVILFRDYNGAELGIDTPLTSNIDLNEVKHSLDIPAFVNTQNYIMEKAVLILYAASNAQKVREAHRTIFPKGFGSMPIPALLFGGVAIRMHSPSCNDPESPFFREPNDIDLILPKKRGSDLVNLLLKLGEIYGTRYYHFVTASDKTFNAIRGGARYRVRTIEKIAEDGAPTPGVLDILTDSVELRHKVDVTRDFSTPAQHRHTISLANILLTKCQFIFDAPASVIPQISEAGLDYRFLNYPMLKSNRVVVGMEEKDIRDVCAILADNPVDGSDAAESVDLTRIKEVLQRDKKFALTFRLNLQNIVEKPQILEGLKIGGSTISRITDGIRRILEVVPVIDKKWDTPWWNTDVETPDIFGKAKVNSN